MDYAHKSRTYLHFDHRLSKTEAERLIHKPEKVATHSFYPFISYDLTVEKIKKLPPPHRQVEKKTKIRPIKIAAHADAAIFSYYGQILTANYESALEKDDLTKCVCAFRKYSGTNIDTAKEIFRYTQQPHFILTFDIEGFFDNLDHQHLKQCWQNLLNVEYLPKDHYAVFRALTFYAEVDRVTLYTHFGISIHNPKQQHLAQDQRRSRLCSPREFRNFRKNNPEYIQTNTKGKGIPQGAPISAFLSNVYMKDFDFMAKQAVEKAGGLYRRYCDDIAIVLPQSCDFQVIETLFSSEIKKLNLSLNTAKTNRAAFPIIDDCQFKDKIQYLGFTKSQTAIHIREGSLSRYYGRMRRAVRIAKRARNKYNQRTGHNSHLRKEKLYRQYSYLIRRRSNAAKYSNHDHIGNFITYAYRAADKLKAPEIRQQVKRHWPKLQKEIKDSVCTK